jgi:hypothetical protein
MAFHCRDAPPSWGLAAGLHVTPRGVTQAAPRSWCLVKVADRLRADGHPRAPDSSVLAWQADGHGDKDVAETRNMLPEKPAPVV